MKPNIIVIGGSAGSVRPLERILASLPRDLPAAVFVVLHVAPYQGTGILEHLGRFASMKSRVAKDGATFGHGEVVFAPPDHHLIVKSDHVRASRTPRENLWRPSIDVLFRSAAVAHGSRVTGVILSGALDDGSAGLLAVKRCGGVAIVQSPAEAEVPSMPDSALLNVAVDHVLETDAIAPELARLMSEASRPESEIPEDLVLEARFAETGKASLEINQKLGQLSEFTCSECSGPLWKRDGEMHRYRCLTGHALSARSLEEGLTRNLDGALWAAIRQFEQRANLCNRMAADERARGRELTAGVYDEREREAREHAQSMRQMLHDATRHLQQSAPKLGPDPNFLADRRERIP
jgi:two-component system, chemotaxis family, protein-glutamate methylesterase/glutaminase